MKLIIKILLLVFPTLLFCDDYNSYYTMIEKGNYDYIRTNLPALRSKNPDSPDLFFISGLVTNNAESALNIFRDFIKKYPKHEKSDNAYMKIIEYNYTRGLYNKTVRNCNYFLANYKSSERIENCINILINSYHAVNQKDSANYYYQKYKKILPHLNLTYSNSQFKPNLSIIEKSVPSNNYVSYRHKSPVEINKNDDLKFSLQFGAFTSPTNALYLRNKLKTKGYNAFTKKIEGQNGKLVAVRVGFFSTRRIAKSVGRQIKKRENLDYMIIKNN